MTREIFVPKKKQLYNITNPHTLVLRDTGWRLPSYILYDLGYMKPHPANRYWSDIDPKFIKNDNMGEFVEITIPENLHVFININAIRNVMNFRVLKKYNKHRTDIWSKVSRTLSMKMDEPNLFIEEVI